MKKKLLSLILSVLLVALLIVPASASAELSEETGNEMIDRSALSIDEEDLTISEEIAYYIAEFFISDMIGTGQTDWDGDTAIRNTVVMTDETGEAVTGYTFELTAGYIVVSAYLDIPSLILEWSDVGEPVYQLGDLQDGDQVVYLGALDYYIDAGEETLETIDGDLVLREDLSNGFEEQRDIQHVDENVLTAIVEAQEEALSSGGITTFANWPGEYITDPIIYAQNVYGGSWWSNNYANYWETHKYASIDAEFSGYGNHCGPVAITNIIKMYGSKYNHSGINSSNKQIVFQEVMYANAGNNGNYFNSKDGTTRSTADAFIRDSFDRFGVTVRTYGQYDVTYQHTVNAVGTSYRLMYISISAKDTHPYGNHAVVGYAYTRLMNASGMGRAFIKICDGKSSAARYVEIDAIGGSQYWEVNFA